MTVENLNLLKNKMQKNKFLLVGDKFMPEMHLRQPGFTYSACGPFTKNKRFFKDLTKRTIADKVLRDKAFKIASDQKYDGYQRGLASIVYIYFDKKSQGSRLVNNKENIQLANELHKPIIRKFKKKCILHLETIFGV